MSALYWRRRVGFDLETTGPDPLTARIVTAALVTVVDGELEQPLTWLINPGVDIPTEASDIHGITTERAQAEGKEPREALDVIATRLAKWLRMGAPVAAYNLAYDWTVLHHELTRHDLRPMVERLGTGGLEEVTLVDPLVIDKRMDRYRKGKRTLTAACEHYKVLLENAHTADADALAAVLVQLAIEQRYPQLRRLSRADLFSNQQLWAASQAAGLQDYFRSAKAGEKQDPNAIVDGSWPLRLGGGS